MHHPLQKHLAHDDHDSVISFYIDVNGEERIVFFEKRGLGDFDNLFWYNWQTIRHHSTHQISISLDGTPIFYEARHSNPHSVSKIIFT